MTGTYQIEHVVYVRVNFLDKKDYTQTSRYFSHNAYPADALYSGSPEIMGGLVSVSGMGTDVGELVPQNRSGTVVLSNLKGIVGVHTRISDYFEDETSINRSLLLRTFQVQPGQTGSSSDEQDEFNGRIRSVEIDHRNDQVRIRAEYEYVRNRIRPKYTNTVNWPDLPDASAGLYLPICFGSAQTACVQLEADGDADPGFAYASGSTTYPTGGVTQYYARDIDGKFAEVISAATTTTALCPTGTGTPSSAFVVREQEYACKLKYTAGTDNYIVTQCEIDLTGGAGSTGGDGVGRITLYEASDYGTYALPSLKVIAFGEFDKSDFDSEYSTQSDFTPRVSFDRPAVLSSTKGYYISISCTNESNGGGWTTFTSYSSKSGRIIAIKGGVSDSESQNAWQYISGADEGFPHRFYGVVMTDNMGATNGSAGFNCTQQSADTGQTNPYLTDIDFVVDFDGLNDTSGGTITGINDQPLNNAYYAIKYLVESGGLDNYDDTKFNPEDVLTTNYPRNIQGASRGRASDASLIQEICKASACRLIGLRSGDVALWAYGEEQATVTTIHDHDCNVLRHIIDGDRTIVNKLQLGYDYKVTNTDLQFLAQGQSRTYAKSYDWENGGSADNQDEIDAWTTDSVSLYGSRELSDSYTNVLFLQDDDDAKFLAKYYLTTRAHPIEYFYVEIPYFVRDYKSLDLMDIIEVSHQSVPSDEGTESSVTAKLPVLDLTTGDPLESMRFGGTWRRAKRHRMRIVGRAPKFNIKNEDPVVLELKLQVLNNPMEIT